MKARLIIYRDRHRREEEITDYVTIGRSPKSKICIKDPHVSKKHCLIFHDDIRGYIVQDFESSNGTFLKGKRITKEELLHDGDEILVGYTRCRFRVTDVDDLTLTQRVDVGEIGGESTIQSHISPMTQEYFLPEKEITDSQVLRTDYEKLRVTYELYRDIGFETEIDQILEKILERTSEFLDYDLGVILMTSENGQLRPRICKTRKKDERLMISSTLIRFIQEEKTAILSVNAMEDQRFKQAESIMLQGLRSTMGVPIVHQDKLLGAMLIESLVSVNEYTEKDLQLLTSIANQTAQFIINFQMSKKIEADAITRQQFQRLLSPDLAEMVVSGGLKVEKGGKSLKATILFVDIRGFTAMSEHMKASEVLQMLNAFFEVMVDVVFRHDGTVDKYLGDGMMAIWGAPVSQADHAHRAVKASLDMLEALHDFNQARMMRGQNPIQVGIGINTGDLVAGYMGSSRTMSYSVIGDTVNTASRLCSVAEADQVLISHTTYRQVKANVTADRLPPIHAKGKLEPVVAYRLLSLQ
jgi:adenylate cyclase